MTYFKAITNPKTGAIAIHKADGEILQRQARSLEGKRFVQFTRPTPLATIGDRLTTLEHVHPSPQEAARAALKQATEADHNAAKAKRATERHLAKAKALFAAQPKPETTQP
jgi:hypothetical protein